jgi:hypothetical protein
MAVHIATIASCFDIEKEAAMDAEQVILQRRDAKVIPHIEQYAPVWLIEQQFFVDDEAVQFNVIFQHPLYGWVNRRYRYDAFNDVLYHKGQNLVSDEEAMDIQETAPWIATITTDIPNSYGG